MLKDIGIVILSLIVGFVTTVALYIYLPKQNLITISIPRVTSVNTTHFSLEKAPTQSLVGTISSLSGQVLWQSRIANAESPIIASQQIQQGESVETTDGTASIAFASALLAQIEKNTQVNIIQTLPADIVIQQTQGTTDYQRLGTIPVSIRGLDLLLSVERGEVTIVVDPLTSHVNVIVKSGKITAAYTNKQNQTNIKTISAGQQLLFNNNTKQLTL